VAISPVGIATEDYRLGGFVANRTRFPATFLSTYGMGKPLLRDQQNQKEELYSLKNRFIQGLKPKSIFSSSGRTEVVP